MDDDALDAFEGAGGDAYRGAGSQVRVGVEALAGDDGAVDARQLAVDFELVKDFDDVGDAVAGEGGVSGEFVGAEEEVAGKEGQEALASSSFSEVGFGLEGEEIGQFVLVEEPGEGLFLSAACVSDPPEALCVVLEGVSGPEDRWVLVKLEHSLRVSWAAGLRSGRAWRADQYCYRQLGQGSWEILRRVSGRGGSAGGWGLRRQVGYRL